MVEGKYHITVGRAKSLMQHFPAKKQAARSKGEKKEFRGAGVPPALGRDRGTLRSSFPGYARNYSNGGNPRRNPGSKPGGQGGGGGGGGGGGEQRARPNGTLTATSVDH